VIAAVKPVRNNIERKRLKALRNAASAGFRALDRGEFKEFDSFDQLRTYLQKLSEQVIAGSDPQSN